MPRPSLRATLIALAALAGSGLLPSREFSVAAFNVENLFDIDGVAAFEEYSPGRYGAPQLLTKVTQLAATIARLGAGAGPDILLLNELEIDRTPTATPPDYPALLQRYRSQTLAELLAQPTAAVADLPAEFFLLKALSEAGLAGYTLVLGADLPSPAGTARPNVQCNAVLTRFPVVATRRHPTAEARQIVEVEVSIDGAPLYVFCNHWKSGASDPASELLRIASARTLRARIDSLLAADPHADLVLGGDFNSHHNQRQRYRTTLAETALNGILGSQGNELAIRGADRALYNLWYELPPPQRGSDVYRDEWGTLIQLIVSRGLYDFRGVQYVDNSFAVAKFPGLNADTAGRPLRWDNSGRGSGVSDHFPVIARFRTVADNAPERWIALGRPPGAEEDLAPVAKVDLAAIDLPAVAVTEPQIPAGANLQDGTWNRRIVRVEAKVVGEQPFRIEFRGQVWEVYSPDPALRSAIWTAHRPGDPIRFYGELGNYKGRWQFVVPDRSWLK